MALQWPNKSVGERLDYQLNWTAALSGDTITASAWTISPATMSTDQNSFTATTATIWLLSGAPNQIYQVTNTITTAAGRIFNQIVNIRVVS